MDIFKRVLNEYNKKKSQILLIGVCGRAGAGKTTLVEKLVDLLKVNGINSVCYSGDLRFKLNSKDRKIWLNNSWKEGLDRYTQAINQFSWWDFDKIHQDLTTLSSGKNLIIRNAYNRSSGEMDYYFNAHIHSGVIFFENCILGDFKVLQMLDRIIVLNTNEQVCFQRILNKDFTRRTFNEIVSRNLITTYSENIFFKLLFDYFDYKTISCDSDGSFCGFPKISDISHIPIPLPNKISNKKIFKGTIFCDLDGTLIKHVPVPSLDGSDIELLNGSVDKLKEFQNKGYYIVLTTSRNYNILNIIENLKEKGIFFDQVIYDLPLGPRHLINDSKGNETRAFSHSLKRDAGISRINIK